MKKIAMILAGCGYKEGTEVTEATSLMISLSQLGVELMYFSPESLLQESNKISRDKTQPLSKLNPEDFDALVLPGGFGAAKHLCNWAEKGASCKVSPEVVRVVREFHSQSKPIGACCIAPVILGKVLGDHEITLTIGDDPETILELEKTGAIHEECPVDDYVSDRANKVITTPAYMYESSPDKVFSGVQGLCRELVEMA